jgi:acetyl esterase
VTDFDFRTPSYRDNGEGYLLNRASMQWFWGHYLGAQDLAKDPYACPARSDNLAGLPPALVATAEFDPLRDEGEAYARALSDAGVPVTATRFDGLMHGFFWMSAAIPSGESLLDDIVTLLRRTWA